MVAKPPEWLLGRASVVCPLGGSVGRVRHPCPVVLVVWLVFVGGLGGITTIGAALRRVAGVSGVYGRKTPRVLAQSAVHLGDMRVIWGFWGVVDDGLGVVVVLMGERWLVVWWLVVCLWCWCGVGRLRWWLGGNCYHRRCLAACRRRVGGLWSQNPPSACSKCSPPR